MLFIGKFHCSPYLTDFYENLVKNNNTGLETFDSTQEYSLKKQTRKTEWVR